MARTLKIPTKIETDYFNLSDFQYDFNILNTDLTTAETDISNLKNGLNSNATLISGLQNQINTSNGLISTNSTKISNLESDNIKNKSDIETVSSYALTLGDYVNLISGYIDTNTTDIISLKNKDDYLVSELARVEGKIPTIGGDGSIDLSKYLNKETGGTINGDLVFTGNFSSSKGVIDLLTSTNFSSSNISSNEVKSNLVYPNISAGSKLGTYASPYNLVYANAYNADVVNALTTAGVTFKTSSYAVAFVTGANNSGTVTNVTYYDLLPSATDTKSLGTVDKKFKDLFLSGAVNATNVASTNLTINGTATIDTSSPLSANTGNIGTALLPYNSFYATNIRLSEANGATSKVSIDSKTLEAKYEITRNGTASIELGVAADGTRKLVSYGGDLNLLANNTKHIVFGTDGTFAPKINEGLNIGKDGNRWWSLFSNQIDIYSAFIRDSIYVTNPNNGYGPTINLRGKNTGGTLDFGYTIQAHAAGEIRTFMASYNPTVYYGGTVFSQTFSKIYFGNGNLILQDNISTLNNASFGVKIDNSDAWRFCPTSTGVDLGYYSSASEKWRNLYLTGTANAASVVTTGAITSGGNLITSNGIACTTNGVWDIGASANKFRTVYASTGTINTSDINAKTNIRPISQSTKARTLSNDLIASDDCYNFIKDDVKMYEFDFIEGNVEGIKTNIGFIAQDIKDSKIGSKIIIEGEQLSYSNNNYINVLAIALKEAIVKIEELKNRIVDLEANNYL